MFRVMLQKLWHKKWMVLCLLIGIILLTATAISFPLYSNAAYNRMLREEFDYYLSKEGKWPAILQFNFQSNQNEGGKSTIQMEQLMDGLDEQLGVAKKEYIYYYKLNSSKAHSLMNRNDLPDLKLRLGFLSDMEEHVKILAGDWYSETGYSEDGAIEAVISQSCLVESRLLVGETMEYEYLLGPDGEPIRVKIVGVFEAENLNEYYWQVTPEEMVDVLHIRESVFRDYFTGDRAVDYIYGGQYFYMWDYGKLTVSDTAKLYDETQDLANKSKFRNTIEEPDYLDILDTYNANLKRIDATLFILQIPIWILLAAFLFMISTQMYDVERNEIAVMKSRGSSELQTFLLYFYQSVFLTVLGTVMGIPLGRFFAELMGTTRGFLEFAARTSLRVEYTNKAYIYAAVAAVGCILMITLPAIKHSRVSIVHLKLQTVKFKRSWWEICFLDIICLAVALYGYYTSIQNQAAIAESTVKQSSLDPLLYLSSSLFILGMGLLLLRIQPLLIHLIYLIGKRFWGPASYMTFMENRKNGRKQQFIMLFLILSISMGMYHSTAARTILQNALENKFYMDGADLIVAEHWHNNQEGVIVGAGGSMPPFQYYEPKFNKYYDLESAASFTKVIKAAGSIARTDSGMGFGTVFLLVGINTKQYGQITMLQEGLQEKHYYEYLNELSQEPDGILLSSNFRDDFGFKIGDTIFYNVYEQTATGSVKAVIVDFVDYWPGYVPSEIVLNLDGSAQTEKRYLMIANTGALTRRWGPSAIPYQVYIDLKDGEGTAEFYQWVEDNHVELDNYTDKQEDMDDVVTDPLMQGTNGILTMGFLVTMVLCVFGYLIYWILSIRSREMIFGVLRAGGMYSGEIVHILINEQIFCGGFSILAGTLIGILTSRMFVPMLQLAYAAADQVLPLQLFAKSIDTIRLYSVIGAVLLICLIVLVLIIRRMDISKALKLGEE